MSSFTFYLTVENPETNTTARTEVNGEGPIAAAEAARLLTISAELASHDAHGQPAHVNALSLYIKPDTEPTTDA